MDRDVPSHPWGLPQELLFPEGTQPGLGRQCRHFGKVEETGRDKQRTRDPTVGTDAADTDSEASHTPLQNPSHTTRPHSYADDAE